VKKSNTGKRKPDWIEVVWQSCEKKEWNNKIWGNMVGKFEGAEKKL